MQIIMEKNLGFGLRKKGELGIELEGWPWGWNPEKEERKERVGKINPDRQGD